MDSSRHTWEGRYSDRELDMVVSTARDNPYNVDEIPGLPHEEPQVLAVSGPRRQTADGFSKLPLESIIMISQYLPTVDALNVRQVSGYFLPIFYSQQF